MKTKLRRITAAVLCMAMLCGMLPASALAAEADAAVRTAGGYTYSRVTDAGAIKDGGEYLLVLVKNENETFFMKPEKRERRGRTGFALESVSCNGSDALTGAYQPYEWTFTKKDSNWLLGYSTSHVKFEPENGDGAGVFLKTQGSTLQIGESEGCHTLSSDGYYFNLDNANTMVSGWKDGPSKFYIYERGDRVEITATPQNAAPDVVGCTLEGEYSHDIDQNWTAGAYQKDLVYLRAGGAKLTLTFNSSGIRVYGKSGSDAGIAKITIDGAEVMNYDQYSAANRYRSLMLDKTWSTSGAHTVTVEYTGEKNDSSGGSLVAVDSFEILRSTPAAPEEPYVPADPENPKQFMDCILPAPVVGSLSDTCWGAADTGPRDQENGLEDKGTGTDGQHYCYWDGGILKDEGTDIYYMFASRWDETEGHGGWPGSVAVYATSDNLYGPYVEQGTLWEDASGAGHNVFPLELKAGGEQVGGITAKYAIVLGDTNASGMQGAIFVSESLAGPWENIGQMPFPDGGGFGLSNICIVLTPEGKYLAYNRNGDIAQADSIGGPWKVLRNNLWNQIPSLSGHGDVEDPVVWYANDLYHCVVNRWDAKKAYYLTSEDGIYEWREHPGTAYVPSADLFQYSTGEVNHWTKIERPNVYIEGGEVKAMTFSVIDVEKDDEHGWDSHGSKVVVTPFSNKGLEQLADCPNEIFDRKGIPASEDVDVASWKSESQENYSGNDYLRLRNNTAKGLLGQNSNPESDGNIEDDCKLGYLKFDVSGYQGQGIAGAELSLVFREAINGDTDTDVIRVALADGEWSESDVTWGTKPTVSEELIAYSQGFSLGQKNQVVKVDVTALIQKALGAGETTVTLALNESIGKQISIASGRYYKGYGPRLSITAGQQRVPATYYVDSTTGSDEDDGLTPETAWKTLGKVSGQTFIPGDKILLKRGCVWEGETLIARGSGSAEKPIVVNSYGDDGRESAIAQYEDVTRQSAEEGEDQKPWIKANHLYEQAVLIKNVEYWEVNNLQVSNDDPQNPGRTDVTEKRYGITVSVDEFPGGTMDHIYVRNCYIHNSNGLLAKHDTQEGNALNVYQKSTEAFPSKLNDLLIEGNHLKHINRNGISFYASGNVRSTEVKIRHNLLEDIGGDGIKPWGLYGCLVEYNKLDGGMERSRDKSAGIWPWDCDNATFQYNEVTGMKSTHDGQAFDIDYLTTNTIFQYNYTHDNEGGFMLLCAPESSYSTGNVVRYNLSVNDGSPGTQDDRDTRKGSVLQIAGNTDTYIYNNTFYLGPDQAGYPVIMVGDWGQSWNQYFYNNVFCIDTPNLTGFLDTGDIKLWERNYKFTTNMVAGKSAEIYKGDLGDPGLGYAPANSSDLFAAPESLTPEGFVPKAGSPLLGKGTEMTMVRDHMFDGNYHFSNGGPDRLDDRYPFLNVNSGLDYFNQPLRAGVPDLGAVQMRNSRFESMATYVGEVPALDGVTWAEEVTAENFRTAYETVTIRGTDAVGSTVVAKVEVIPQNTVYFLDLGKNSVSDAYSSVKALVGDSLLNDKPDQTFTGDALWGHTASEYNAYESNAIPSADKGISGVYADNSSAGYITYKLHLEAGQYTITSYHKDWWQNGDRPMDIEAKIIMSDGSALPTWRCRDSWQAGSGAAVTYAFAMPENGTLEYTVRSTADQAAVMSWLAVQKGGSAFAPRTAFSGVTDDVWLDTDGYPIQAHGGEVRQFTVGGVTKYYLIGEDRSARGWPTDGVRVYSSDDLYNWKDEGLALRTMNSKDQFANDEYFKALYGDLSTEEQDALYVDLSQAAVIERPKMLYNEKTGKYVIWFHADGPTEGNGDSYGKAKAGVAVADSPAGPFKLLGSYSLNYVADMSQGFDGGNLGAVRDMNVFRDDDGTAYIIYSSQGNETLFISKLNEDYTALATDRDSAVRGVDFDIAFERQSREAPAMFKYDGRYYMITSGCTGWSPNEAQYAVADSPLGPWHSWGNPCEGDEADKTFRTQSTAVIPVDPEKGLFIYMGDRWSQKTYTINTSGYVWLPIEMKPDGGVKITPYSDWNMEALKALAPVKADPITAYLGDDLPATIDVALLGLTHNDTPVTWDSFAVDKIGSFTVGATLTELDSRRVQIQVHVIPENAVYFVDSGADGETNYFSAVADGNQATLKNFENADQPYEGAATWGYEGSNSGTDGGGAENAYQSIRYVYGGSATPLNYSFALDAGSYQVSVGHYDPWSEWAKGNRVANVSARSGERELTAKNDIAITGDHSLTVLDEVTLAEDEILQVRFSPKNTGENSDVMVSFIAITRAQDAPPSEHTHALTHHEAVASTCTETGTIEYWQCSDQSCAKLFGDEQGERELQPADLAVEMLPHDFNSETWESGKSGHWHVCTTCNAETTEVEEHTSGGEATEDTAETCTVCGYEINPPLSHTHIFDSEWTYDKTNHWHKCTGCEAEEEGSRAIHDWKLNNETSTETEKHYDCLCGAEKTESVTPPALDKTPIDAAIARAEGARAGISVSDAEPSDVPSGSKFVSTAAMKALTDAIQTATDAKNTVTTTEEVTAVVSALEVAVTAFEAAIREGVYVPPYTPPSGGGGSSNITTETEKNDDGSTTKTETDKKTGAVTETTTWPDGTKQVVEKKANGSMTATETRKDGTKVTAAATSDGETTADVTVPKDKRVTVTIPTAEKPAPGVVAVIEYADGTREVIKSSVAAEEGLRITLDRDASLKLVDNTKHFADVKDSDWSAEAVAFVSSRELFNGVGGDRFVPEASVTRGMFLTVLHRYNGNDETMGETWYSGAQTWAVETGLSDGTRMEDVITREQLVTLLYRFAGMPQQPEEETELASFADTDEVTDYAVKAMKWAVSTGLLNGKNGSWLAPAGTASRAEVAAIIQRFAQLNLG